MMRLINCLGYFYDKLERYKFSIKLNHFALKGKLSLNIAKAALGSWS